MDDSYWITLQNRLLDTGFITITTIPDTGKNYWRPTPRGIRAYKAVLELTKRNRLFKGPKFTDEELEYFTRSEAYEQAKEWLTKHDMLRPIYDMDTKQDKYELVEYGYEFFQIYTDAITSGPRNPGPHLLRKMASSTLMILYFAGYAIIKVIADSYRKKEQKKKGYRKY